ncbi:MAG: ATPase domain-containing protein [Halochromatium sp.]
MTEPAEGLVKRETGISGLDQMTQGGLPAAGGTLILGHPAAGKTVLALQILALAIARGEGGVFVSFEESRQQVLRDAASFSWGRHLQDESRFELIDARPASGARVSGEFDLEGLLAAVAHCIERTGAPWLVFDGIDQLLRRQQDLLVATDQIHALSNWCEKRDLSLILTGKLSEERLAPTHLEGIEFLLPSVLVLSTTLVSNQLSRRFRIAKYRGTAHVIDEVAMLLDDDGMHFPYAARPLAATGPASHERVSTGIDKLDAVLGGGLYRGSATLISGQPGTAKTTLCGSFSAAAAACGERTLYFSFDEQQAPVIRNLGSVGIDLDAPIAAGLIQFHARDAWSGLVEEHYHALLQLMHRFQPDCLVIDPVSALLKAAGADSAQVAIEQLLAITRARGITTLLTSLGTQTDPTSEATLSHASTLADTWLVLGYNVRGGERNRSLSVVKSRGSAHSDQVRELILSHQGVDLAEVYEYGTEVLMGTARMQKESEEAIRHQLLAIEAEQRRRALEQQINQAEAEADRLRLELQAHEEERLAREQSMQRQERDVIKRRQPQVRHTDANHSKESQHR